jgi:hypothetical protein
VVDENPETFITEKLDSFFLWADAICINQEDEEEKARQISRMGDIYRLANRVYAWLGENEKDEDDGIHKVMGMAHCVGMAFGVSEAYLIWLFDSSVDNHNTFARGIANLSTRPWVSRLWVVQEVVLASKSLIILAGRAWLYLDSLYKLATIMVGHPTRSLNHISRWETVAHLGLLFLIRKYYQRNKHNQGTFDVDSSSPAYRLNRILGLTQGHYKATLSHDYIYELLGLVGTEALPSVLTPNYNRPYSQVCQEYTRFVFESTGNLSLLLRLSSKTSGVPSWVTGF